MLADVIKVKLNEALKKRAKALGEPKFSLYRLQKETGISYSALHHLASGDAKGISFDMLENLCKFFDCKVSDLLELIDD